ncbi:MAG: hypothetical protein ACO1SV_16155 [Fimbriimonas sp.]
MLKRITLLFAAVALSGAAAAQAKLDPFDAHCSDIVALQAKPVQKELGVTEAQRKQMNVHATWHQGQLKAVDAEIKAKKTDPNSPALQARLAKLFEGLKGRVLSALTATQVKRLREISIQRVGDAALCDPIVAKRVGMSADQLKKMQTTYAEGARKFAELEQSTAQKILLPYKDRKPKDEADAKRLNAEVQKKMATAAAQVRPKLNAIRADYGKRMKAILTSTQAKTFAALRGKPFSGS